MKMIINGKRYDTETATLMASYDNGLSRRDFRFLSEELYKKKTGEFFLYGNGGALTYCCRKCCDGTYCNGETIVPLSFEEAKEWVERQANEKYEEIFGECEE